MSIHLSEGKTSVSGSLFLHNVISEQLRGLTSRPFGKDVLRGRSGEHASSIYKPCASFSNSPAVQCRLDARPAKRQKGAKGSDAGTDADNLNEWGRKPLYQSQSRIRVRTRPYCIYEERNFDVPSIIT